MTSPETAPTTSPWIAVVSGPLVAVWHRTAMPSKECPWATALTMARSRAFPAPQCHQHSWPRVITATSESNQTRLPLKSGLHMSRSENDGLNRYHGYGVSWDQLVELVSEDPLTIEVEGVSDLTLGSFLLVELD